MIAVKKSELLSPILCIATIYGLSNKTTKRVRATIPLYILRCSYNVLFIVISGYTVLFILYRNDPLMGFELVIKIVVSNLTGITITVSGFLNQQQFMKVVSLMKSREEELLKYTKDSCNKNIKLFMFSQFALLLLLQGHNLLITYFKFCKNEDKIMASCIGSWLVFNLYPSLSFVHSIMFSTLILIVKSHFLIINNVLLHINNKTTMNIGCEKLQQLKRMHSHLTRDFKAIIHIFSIPTLFKFLDASLLVFCCVHFFITEYKATSVPLRSHISEASMVSLNTALVPIAELLTVILVCQSTSGASGQMAVVLHKLYGSCKRQRKQIKIVSLLLLLYAYWLICFFS